MFLSTKDLEHKLHLSPQTIRDLTAHRWLGFFPYAKVNSKKNRTHYFNIWADKSVNRLAYLMARQEGKTNDERAKNLLKVECIFENQKDQEMMYSMTDVAELSRKVDQILAHLSINSEPKPANDTVKNAEKLIEQLTAPVTIDELLDNDLRASSAINELVKKAVKIIVSNIESAKLTEFKKGNLVYLVMQEDEPLGLRMNKDKDTVWVHTRKFLLDHGYVKVGRNRDLLELGNVADETKTSN